MKGRGLVAHCRELLVMRVSVAAARRDVDDNGNGPPASACFGKIVSVGHQTLSCGEGLQRGMKGGDTQSAYGCGPRA